MTSMLRASKISKTPLLLEFLAPSLIPWTVISSTVRAHKGVSLSRASSSQATLHQSHPKHTELAPHARLNNPLLSFDTTIAALRHSFLQNDIISAGKHWVDLETHNLLPYIGPAHLEYCSRKLCQIIPLDNPEVWSDAECRIAETIALAAAASRSAPALQLCMTLRLKKNQPDPVIQLYQKYCLLADGVDNSDAEDVNERLQYASQLALPEDDIEDTRISGHSPLLIAVVTAHVAKRSSFMDIYRVVDRPDIPRLHFASSSVEEFINQLPHNPKLQSEARAIFPRLYVAKLVSHPGYLASHALDLSKRATTRLENLYRDFLHNISDPGGCLTNTRSGVTPSRPILVDETVWAAFLTAQLQSPHKTTDQKKLVGESIWTDMTRSKGKPGTAMYSSLIQGYAHMQDEEEAIRAWNAMISQGIRPDTGAYRAMISSLLTAKQQGNAMTWLERFEKTSLKGTFGSDLGPILKVYNSAISRLLANNGYNDAVAIVDRMRIVGHTPDVATHNAFIHYHANRGELKAVALALQGLERDKAQPDAYTFSIILEALLKVGRMDAVELVFRMLTKYDIKAGVVMYTSVVHHLVSARKPSYLAAALDILRRMEEDPDVRPSAYTYVALLSGLYRGRWLDPDIAREAESFILNRMNTRNVKMNSHCYNSLIKSCLFNPGPGGVQRMLVLYKEAKAKRILVDNGVRFKALERLVKMKEWTAANEMLKD